MPLLPRGGRTSQTDLPQVLKLPIGHSEASPKNLAVKAVKSEILRCPLASAQGMAQNDNSRLALIMTHYQKPLNILGTV